MPRPARRLLLACVSTVAAASAPVGAPAWAGPPFVTDDPAPTDLHHWEIYNFASLLHAGGDFSGQGGLDLNYGAFREVQLTAVFPLGYDTSPGRPLGASNIELAGKYRILHPQDGGLAPDVAVFPRLFVPSGGKRFGTGHASLLLPVWVGKDIAGWSVFGGGGYLINPGRGQRNAWQSGVGATHAVNDRLTLGAEVYHRTADTQDGAAFTGVNVGALYKLSTHWSLIGSAGPGVQNAAREGRYAVYGALKADY